MDQSTCDGQPRQCKTVSRYRRDDATGRVPGKPIIYQELNRFRIDTLGEKKQLSAWFGNKDQQPSQKEAIKFFTKAGAVEHVKQLAEKEFVKAKKALAHCPFQKQYQKELGILFDYIYERSH